MHHDPNPFDEGADDNPFSVTSLCSAPPPSNPHSAWVWHERRGRSRTREISSLASGGVLTRCWFASVCVEWRRRRWRRSARRRRQVAVWVAAGGARRVWRRQGRRDRRHPPRQHERKRGRFSFSLLLRCAIIVPVSLCGNVAVFWDERIRRARRRSCRSGNQILGGGMRYACLDVPLDSHR
jgi:hypothetical protein